MTMGKIGLRGLQTSDRAGIPISAVFPLFHPLGSRFLTGLPHRNENVPGRSRCCGELPLGDSTARFGLGPSVGAKPGPLVAEGWR